MASFDVTSFFTNAAVGKTTGIILKRVYEKKEITTTIPKREKNYYAQKVIISLLIMRYINRMLWTLHWVRFWQIFVRLS